MQVATYHFPQPIGTAIPRIAGYRLASLDPSALDLSRAVARDEEVSEAPAGDAVAFPTLDRRLKGDALIQPARPVLATEPAAPSARTREAHAAFAPEPEPALANAPELAFGPTSPDDPTEDGVWPVLTRAELNPPNNPTMDTARLYFGVDPLDAPPSALDRTEASLEPAIPTPAPRPAEPVQASKGGETIADKGDVSSKRRLLSPAERLGLRGRARAKSERCLANAVYFEARGEPVRGQIAVAQVVMNRVFSEFYPDNVCDVVYQNANRHNACQFTFACDGIPDVVTEPEAWRRAKRIAKDTLDGKLWLDHIGKATHYHAYWVHPSWVNEMRKLYKLGVHTFYRPRNWGSGADEPSWGDPKTTAALVKTL
jgi:hypothetical protein